MRYLALIPLLIAGAVTFCVTTVRVDAEDRSGDAVTSHPQPAVDAAVAAERAFRHEHRAFYTAPPVIPHELFPASAGDCLTCHREERQYFGKTSTKTPHPHWTNCNQCHLPSRPAFAQVEAEPVETTWTGLGTPTDGERISIVAPPTMPHRVLFREDCQSCHSHKSPFASMRGPHPERTNCIQCHVSGADLEFRLVSEEELPAP